MVSCSIDSRHTNIVIALVACGLVSACAPNPNVGQQYAKDMQEMLLASDCVSLVDPYFSEAQRAEARKSIEANRYICPDPKTHAEYYRQKIEENKRNRAAIASRDDDDDNRNVWVNVNGQSKHCTRSGSNVWC